MSVGGFALHVHLSECLCMCVYVQVCLRIYLYRKKTDKHIIKHINHNELYLKVWSHLNDKINTFQ